MTGVAAGDTEGTVGTALNLGGDVALLDLLDGEVGRGNGEGGGEVGGAVDLGDVGLGVTLLGGVGLAGEQDQALLVSLEAGDVDGQGLLREVLAAGVDGDTDGRSLEAGDTSFLQRLLILKNFLQSAVVFLLRKDYSIPAVRNSYLELSKRETTAGTDLAVVLEGRASHDRAQLVDRARSDGSSLGLTGSTARSLLASL